MIDCVKLQDINADEAVLDCDRATAARIRNMQDIIDTDRRHFEDLDSEAKEYGELDDLSREEEQIWADLVKNRDRAG